MRSRRACETWRCGCLAGEGGIIGRSETLSLMQHHGRTVSFGRVLCRLSLREGRVAAHQLCHDKRDLPMNLGSNDGKLEAQALRMLRISGGAEMILPVSTLHAFRLGTEPQDSEVRRCGKEGPRGEGPAHNEV